MSDTKKQAKITTTIRLTEDVHFKLVKMTNDTNRSMSNLIETILLNELTDSQLEVA